MIYVLMDEKGQWDDYEPFLETVLSGPTVDINVLCQEFNKTLPRKSRWVTGQFAKWLIEAKGFEKIEYELFNP